MRFVDVKNDVAFHKIFGNEKKTEILVSFLNAILKLEGKNRIQEVSIINPYLVPRIAGEKASVIDVRAKDEKGRQFVIEMQVADVEGFGKRVQYYTCRDYSMQIKKGDDYRLLKPTYFIGILDFNFFESPEYLSHHIILDGKTYEHKLKDIQFSFIELKKFHLEVDELKTLTEKWVFFIKNAENLDVIPENVDDEGLEEAYNDAQLHSWDKEELIAYDNTFIAEQDKRGRVIAAEKKAVAKGYKKGHAEGHAGGRIEGKIEEKKEVVERCWEDGMAIEMIAKIAGLSVEDVKKIIHKLDQQNNNQR